jgi:hypothetical protein
MDVAGKPTEPAPAKTGPERGSDDRHRHANNDQKLANIFHLGALD